MSSPPGKIAVVQVSSGASCNASLPSTRRGKRLVNRDEIETSVSFQMGCPERPLFLVWEDPERNGGVTVAPLCERRIQ